MLLSFFYLLREGGMQTSVTEWLALLEASVTPVGRESSRLTPVASSPPLATVSV